MNWFPKFLTWKWWRARAAVLASALVSTDRFLVMRGNEFVTLTKAEMQNFLRNAPGELSVPLLWDVGTAANPGAGKMRFNHATLASVTGLEISEVGTGSLDIVPFLAKMVKGAMVKITKSNSDGSTYWLGTVTSVTDNGTHRSVVVVYVSSAGTFADEDEVLLTVSNTQIPALPGAGTYTLKSIDGVLTFVVDA
jgi:hypothetical protein